MEKLSSENMHESSKNATTTDAITTLKMMKDPVVHKHIFWCSWRHRQGCNLGSLGVLGFSKSDTFAQATLSWLIRLRLKWRVLIIIGLLFGSRAFSKSSQLLQWCFWWLCYLLLSGLSVTMTMCWGNLLIFSRPMRASSAGLFPFTNGFCARFQHLAVAPGVTALAQCCWPGAHNVLQHSLG